MICRLKRNLVDEPNLPDAVRRARREIVLAAKFDPNIHRRQSIRLQDYDYSQPGAYFVTICAWNRENIFGYMIDEKIRLNPYGFIVEDEWIRSETLRPHVILDSFVVMPNHFHGILMVSDYRGTARRAPTEQFGKPAPDSVPTIVRAFKSSVSRRINKVRGAQHVPVWQCNYYEHVIRGEAELGKVRQYIIENPSKWAQDPENPMTTPSRPGRGTARRAHDEKPWDV